MLQVELKKFFKPIILLVALLVSILFYQLQLNFLYTGLPNGFQTEIYKYVFKWRSDFGKTMTDADFSKVEEDYQTLRKEADKYVLESDYGKKNDLKNYTEFRKSEETLPKGSIYDMSPQDEQKMSEYSQFNTNNLFFQLSAYEMIKEGLGRFESEKNFFDQRESSDKRRSLIRQVIFEEESWRNILPEGLPGTLASHVADMLLLAMVCMGMLLPSVFVKDNLLKIKSTQWSSRRGRSLIRTQYLATQIGAFIIITVLLLIFLLPIVGTKFSQFFDSALNSFLTESFLDSEYSFLHVTFGQWIWLLVLLVYLVGLSFSSGVFLVAQTSKNYLSMLMKLIPLLAVFIVLDYW
ncbi:MAG: hypothetical protein RR470_06830, partial [Vagococcus sp.]